MNLSEQMNSSEKNLRLQTLCESCDNQVEDLGVTAPNKVMEILVCWVQSNSPVHLAIVSSKGNTMFTKLLEYINE